MLKVSNSSPPSKPRTSFSIDDIVGRPRSRSPRSRPSSRGSSSTNSDVTSPSAKSEHYVDQVEALRSRLSGERQPEKGFQPVLPGLHGPALHHPVDFFRTGLINSEGLGLLHHNLQSSHPVLKLPVGLHHGAHGILGPPNGQPILGPGLPPFGPHVTGPKDFLNLCHLQMHGAPPHLMGHRFPGTL